MALVARFTKTENLNRCLNLTPRTLNMVRKKWIAGDVATDTRVQLPSPAFWHTSVCFGRIRGLLVNPARAERAG